MGPSLFLVFPFFFGVLFFYLLHYSFSSKDTMSSTIHFHDPANFQSQSDEFISWLSGKPGVKVNPKIRLADLRSRAAGRGVGT